ncbi:MAG: hypothetical protein ACRENI_13940 [Gemmatimonadaceae bacterium]
MRTHFPGIAALLAIVSGIGVLPHVLAAQAVTVDEGSFTVTRNGEDIGREQFRIIQRQSRGNSVYLATATSAYSDRRLAPALETDSTGAPLRYQVEVHVDGDLSERLSGLINRGRFSARSQTPRGESAREYIVADGALILDEDVFHQYYFLHGRTGDVAVVVPRRNVQTTMRVESMGTESLAIGGETISAEHMVLTETGAGVRDIWLDAEGRVLRVAIPSRGIIATRDDPPG